MDAVPPNTLPPAEEPPTPPPRPLLFQLTAPPPPPACPPQLRAPPSPDPVPADPEPPQLMLGPMPDPTVDPTVESDPPQLTVVVLCVAGVLKVESRSARAAYLSLMAEKLVAVFWAGVEEGGTPALLAGVALRGWGCRPPPALLKGWRGAAMSASQWVSLTNT